ncbi:hypothetical protein DXV76_06255 [Rhodobacteraceae bacterium CCMM004]|nr:hypothetical protein DXV76_06255 [Rhodobacteraceae bacterium CCMM004]
MFTDLDPARLRRALNVFRVPTWVADRQPGWDEFRVVCINDAHAAETGLTDAAVAGRRLSDLLPWGEAAAAGDRYAACALGDAQHYRERLSLAGRPMVWDTSLAPVEMADGRARVLGNAVARRPSPVERAGVVALDEIRFLAARAEMHMAEVKAWMDTEEHMPISGPARAGPVSAVAGLCRAVDHALAQIRQQSETAEGGSGGPTARWVTAPLA